MPQDEREYLERELIFYIIMLVIDALALIAMLYVGYRVISMTECGNFRLTLFVIGMNLTLILDLTFRAYMIHTASESL